MRKVLVLTGVVLIGVLVYAFTIKNETDQAKPVASSSGQVIPMDKAMFIKDIFDFEKSKEWKYKGTKPAIIDLYADWCGPCKMIAPTMKDLAKEYAGKINVYKVDVDRQKELAAFFNATSIPLVVYIPMKGEPQFIRGAADKATFKKGVDEFLLK